MDDHQMIFLIGLRRDDGVGNARLVFQAEKDKTFCGAGSLTRDYRSGNEDVAPIGQGG